MDRKQTQPLSAIHKSAEDHVEHLETNEAPAADDFRGLPKLLDTKRNRGFCPLADEYLKGRMRKVASVKEFSGQPKTRLTKIVSGNLLLLVWEAEYEPVNTKKDKVRKRVKRNWDMETHLHAHKVWSHIWSEVSMFQCWFQRWTVAKGPKLRLWHHRNGFEVRYYVLKWTVLGCDEVWRWAEVCDSSSSMPGTRRQWSGMERQWINHRGKNSIKVKLGCVLSVSSDAFLTHADAFWEHQCGNQLFSFWFWKALPVLWAAVFRREQTPWKINWFIVGRYSQTS